MKIDDLLAGLPTVNKIAGARERIGEILKGSNCKLIVVDDDPTGTQTVHSVRVYMEWTPQVMNTIVRDKNPVSFVSANTRALDNNDAVELAKRIGTNLKTAADGVGVKTLVASRSDSTLRGHFPDEVDALATGLGMDFDGVIIAPAFFEAGRYTVEDVQWVDQGDRVVSAAETEFAKDPTFGYKNANLKMWVEEKTDGKISASDVESVSLNTIRCLGVDAIYEQLMSVNNKTPVIVNSACYEDLEVFMLGLIKAESEGKKFIYRCAAPFVKVRAGIADRKLLDSKQIGTNLGPGVVIAGSYVEKTSRQLNELRSNGVDGFELDVDKLVDDKSCDSEIRRATEWIDSMLARGSSIAVYTSRQMRESNANDFLENGKKIMSGLCKVVADISVRPSFIISKGGITSMEVARLGLGVKGADVLGQILPGVPVWKLGEESKWPGMVYVVFPGNVGGDSALCDAVKLLGGDGE